MNHKNKNLQLSQNKQRPSNNNNTKRQKHMNEISSKTRNPFYENRLG